MKTKSGRTLFILNIIASIGLIAFGVIMFCAFVVIAAIIAAAGSSTGADDVMKLCSIFEILLVIVLIVEIFGLVAGFRNKPIPNALRITLMVSFIIATLIILAISGYMGFLGFKSFLSIINSDKPDSSNGVLDLVETFAIIIAGLGYATLYIFTILKRFSKSNNQNQ